MSAEKRQNKLKNNYEIISNFLLKYFYLIYRLKDDNIV